MHRDPGVQRRLDMKRNEKADRDPGGQDRGQGHLHPGFTHQRSEVERYAKSGNFRASSALRKAPVSKPRRVVVGRASLSERFDA